MKLHDSKLIKRNCIQ